MPLVCVPLRDLVNNQSLIQQINAKAKRAAIKIKGLDRGRCAVPCV